VATDVHLGYMERDPIRRDDSFEAFDEILTKAEEEEVRLWAEFSRRIMIALYIPPFCALSYCSA